MARVPVSLCGPETMSKVGVRIGADYGQLLVADSHWYNIHDAAVAGSESIEFYGTPAEVNKSLTAIWYSPKDNWNSRGQGTFETITVMYDVYKGGQVRPGLPQPLTVLVEAVNDPPVISAPAEVVIREDERTIIEGIVVSDIDAHETPGAAIKAHVSVEQAGSHLQLGTGVGLYFTSSTDRSKTFLGSVANVNAALAGLSFQGLPEYAGQINLTVTISDGGNTGEGGVLNASVIVQLVIEPINNAPYIVVDQEDIMHGTEDVALPIPGVRVGDRDAGVYLVRLAIEALQGTVSLGRSNGTLEYIKGDGAFDTNIDLLGNVQVCG